METQELIRRLQEIKNTYPILTNDEILKIMELKILFEIRAELGGK